AGQTATGSILDWYRRHFAGREQAEAERRGVHVYQVLDEEAALIPAGAEGLIVRDDRQGNRSPYKNPQARGAIVGLSLAHGTRARLSRSLRSHGLRHAAHPRGRRHARPCRRANLHRRRGPVGRLAPASCRRSEAARASDPRNYPSSPITVQIIPAMPATTLR
ncbi:MAG: FGGY-family carbohydrate kinase, partial [Isosphaeraceae bacterium]